MINRTTPRPIAGLIAMLAGALLLSGCGGIFSNPPVPDIYNLTPKSTFPGELTTVDWQLAIEEPIAARGLDTPRIAVRPKPTQIQYMAGARWTDRAPKMVQTLLIESFENSEKIVAVGRHAIGLRSDYHLKTELREFQTEFYGDEEFGVVRVRINAKMIEQPRQVIIASENFERSVVVSGAGAAAIVDAFDEALGGVMKRLVVWALAMPAS